jgi:hypothetical protein
MRKSLILALLLASFAFAQQTMPRMSTVDPGNGKTGDVLTISGENLAKSTVAKLYLTDGKNDVECKMVEQSDSAIKFTIPKISTGRFSLMLLTTGKEPKLIEQPVRVTIE